MGMYGSPEHLPGEKKQSKWFHYCANCKRKAYGNYCCRCGWPVSKKAKLKVFGVFILTVFLCLAFMAFVIIIAKVIVNK